MDSVEFEKECYHFFVIIYLLTTHVCHCLFCLTPFSLPL